MPHSVRGRDPASDSASVAVTTVTVTVTATSHRRPDDENCAHFGVEVLQFRVGVSMLWKQTRKTRKTRTSERIVKGILKGIPNMSRTQYVLLFSNVKPERKSRKAERLGLSLCAARRCSLATGHLDVKR